MKRASSCAIAAACLCAAVAPSAHGGTSKLWGEHGELWTATGRLPDYSHAGYHEGEAPLPDVPVVASVLDYGAKGDGVTDDTQAFVDALAAISQGTLLVPAGHYVLSGELSIHASGVVLRGEGSGQDGSVLVFTKSLTDLHGAAPQWSWLGGLIHFQPSSPGTTTLTPLSAPALRGDGSLTVADASSLHAGDVVLLRLVDDGTGSLGRHLHDEQADSGDCSYQVPLRFDWPFRVAQVAGSTVTPTQPLRTDARLEWGAEVRSFEHLSEVGVEHLAIEMPDVPYAGHLLEPGYNAVFFDQGVVDAWVRDVRFRNVDNAIICDQRVKAATFTGLVLEGRQGHHGLNLQEAADLLVDGFLETADYVHGVTVDHRSNGVVFTRGTSTNPMALDHHRDSPLENLFTELGTYNFASGGNTCAGPHAGARNTYWNLAAPMVIPYLWSGIQTNAIGDLAVPEQLTEDNEWFEPVTALDPPNLYDAQLGARLCAGEAPSTCQRLAWDVATGACNPVARADGTPCDDGDPTTSDDGCVAGACVGSAAETSGSGGGSGVGGGSSSASGAGGSATSGSGGASARPTVDDGGCAVRGEGGSAWIHLAGWALLGGAARTRRRRQRVTR